MQKSKRVILLSGTPLVNYPADLYSQISIIRPDICPHFEEFCDRYCYMGGTANGANNTGCYLPDELGYILRNSIMIRRLKSEVLTNLPTLTRVSVLIQVPKEF